MRLSQPTRRFFARALLGPALAVVACSDTATPEYNVVIVLVDQLRADSAEIWMPKTTALAERGIAFDNMRAAAAWTYPSVISLMTGLYPQQHGATGDPHDSRLSTFDPALPLLPKRLQTAGYRTAAFVANPFLQRFHSFHEGFDHYDISFVKDLGNVRGTGRLWNTPRMFADSLNTAIFTYFDERPLTSPEFTYVHYIDAHGPWDAAPFSPNYESAIRFTDERVAELYDYFKQRYHGKFLFFVTSDHGRPLGDDLRIGDGRRFRFRKKSMHDFNLRIPLFVLPGTYVPESRRITQSSSNVDLVPTLLEWLDIETKTPFAGVSLMPAIRGEQPDPANGSGRAIYAKNDAFGLRTDAMVRENRKYMRYLRPDGEVAATKTFDLENDPRETEQLEIDGRDAESILAELSKTRGIEYPAIFIPTDPTLLKQLQALGYMGE